MNAVSILDFRDLLPSLPVEPGRSNGLPPEERFVQLDCFLRQIGTRMGSCGCALRISSYREEGAVAVYFSRQSGYFGLRFVFNQDGAIQVLEGGARQPLGSWREGVIRIVCDLVGYEQEDVDLRVRNVQGFSQMLTALRDGVQGDEIRSEQHPTAPQAHVAPSPPSGQPCHPAYEWT